MNYKTIEDVVTSFHTKHELGFNSTEQETLVNYFKSNSKVFNIEKYNSALTGITCAMGPNGIIIYPCDMITAIACATQDRDMKPYEFD